MTQRYGFMREIEADLVDKLLSQIKTQFGEIRMIEVGVFGAGTTRGVYRWGKENDCPVFATGIDFEQYRPNPTPDANYDFHSGDSMDQWRGVKGIFNFLFIDACHCVVHSSQDFLNYSPLVEVGGFILLHDTALPTDLGKDKQEEWPQDHSYAGKSNSVLGVREALKKLGLLDGRRTDFELIDEIESSTGLMGMMLYRRILPY